MAEPQANVTQLPASAPKLGLAQCFIQGRIAYARKQKTEQGHIHLTLLKVPAVDQYSHPSTIEVSSREKLGDVNDDWKGVCNITGYPRTFDTKPDPETGEVKTIRTATINLRAVEQ